MVDNNPMFSVFLFLLSLISCHAPFRRILMGKRASFSLRFNLLCIERLQSHSFLRSWPSMMSWGLHLPQVKFICFVSQEALKMAAHLICIYRGVAIRRHSVKLSTQNQAACNIPETVFLGVSFFPIHCYTTSF